MLGAGLRAALGAILAVLLLWAVARLLGTWTAVAVGLIGGFAFVLGMAFAGVSRIWSAGSRFLDRLGRSLAPPSSGTASGARNEAAAAGPYPNASALSQEIAAASDLSGAEASAARLARLSRVGLSVGDPALARAIARLVEASGKLSNRLAAAPRALPRQQAALARQLASVESVLLTLLRLQDSDSPDSALTGETVTVIERLADDLNRRRLTTRHDLVETEARLRLLREELAAATGSSAP